MSLFRRAAPVPAERRPHPDPRVEAELQRIISLRKAIARKEADLDQIQVMVAKLRHDAKNAPNLGSTYGKGGRLEQIRDYQQETEDLEAEVTGLHDEIAKRITALSDTDVAYL